MANLLKFRAIGFRNALGRFATRQRLLQVEKREMVREVSRDYVRILREESPKDTEVYANGIAYRTDDRGNITTGTVYVRGEHAFLTDIILNGSKPHVIPTGGAAAQLAKGYPLRFFWQKGPQGPGVYRFWKVNHPGTRPNDFVGRANARMARPAQERLNRVSSRVANLA